MILGFNFKQILANIFHKNNIDITTFGQCLSSKKRLSQLKQKKVETSSVGSLLKGLASLNIQKLTICFMLFAVKFGITIAGPFIINQFIHNITHQQDSRLSLPVLIMLILTFKIVSSLVNIISDFYYVSISNEYFAYLYWSILNRYNSLSGSSGRKVNIIEYDCNLITSIGYSALTSLFSLLQTVVVFGMLTFYLIHSSPFSIFALLVIFYVAAQVVVSVLTFRTNRNYTSQKDRRLDLNISNEHQQPILQQREKQLKANRQVLHMRVASKFISMLFPILINLYVFVIADRSSFQDQEYIILILINLIKSPISEFTLAMSYNLEILNSCKRIVSLTSGGDQSSSEEPLTINQQVCIQEQELVSVETGNVEFTAIFRYFAQNTTRTQIGLLMLGTLFLLATCIYSLTITQHIVGRSYQYYHFIGLGLVLLAPILLFLLLIRAINTISSTLFHRIKREMDFQTLNRLSGDIASIDRKAPANLFDIVGSLSFILGSYLYSILSLPAWWVKLGLFLFLAGCVWISLRSNRFIMHSRREVERRQLEQKSIILRGLLEGRKLEDDAPMNRSWHYIFECKEMGLLIENFYMGVISMVLLLLSLILILVSYYLPLQDLPRSILLMACLTIDNDISNLFFGAVKLELSLVSFERVLNALAP